MPDYSGIAGAPPVFCKESAGWLPCRIDPGMAGAPPVFCKDRAGWLPRRIDPGMAGVVSVGGEMQKNGMRHCTL